MFDLNQYKREDAQYIKLRDQSEEIGQGYYYQDLRQVLALGFKGRGVYASVDARHLSLVDLDKLRWLAKRGFKYDVNRLRGFKEAINAWNDAMPTKQVVLNEYPKGTAWGVVFSEA